jgi:hypothetical protein
MGLLDTEILSNRWDVENSLNNAMNERAMGWGQLDRTAYAPMTASTALQGDMQGQSIGGLFGGQQVEMQKQDIIDNIMAKNPDPRTSSELRDVAKQFAEAGLTDYSFQITEVANELYKSEVDKNTPTDVEYKAISTYLGNYLLTNDVLELYAKQKWGLTGEWDDMERIEKNDWLDKAKGDLKGHIENYADRKKMYNLTKKDIAKLKSNDAEFLQDFLQDLDQYGNRTVRSFFQSISQFDTTGNKKTVSISSEYAERLTDDEIVDLGLEGIRSLYDAYNKAGVENLNKTQKDVYDRLKKYINEPSQLSAGEATIREDYIKRFPDWTPERVEEFVKAAMERAGKTYTGNQTSSLSLNNDNVASWVVRA